MPDGTGIEPPNFDEARGLGSGESDRRFFFEHGGPGHLGLRGRHVDLRLAAHDAHVGGRHGLTLEKWDLHHDGNAARSCANDARLHLPREPDANRALHANERRQCAGRERTRGAAILIAGELQVVVGEAVLVNAGERPSVERRLDAMWMHRQCELHRITLRGARLRAESDAGRPRWKATISRRSCARGSSPLDHPRAPSWATIARHHPEAESR